MYTHKLKLQLLLWLWLPQQFHRHWLTQLRGNTGFLPGNNFLPSTWTCGLPLKLSNFTTSIRWHSNSACTVPRKLLQRFWCHSTTQRQLQKTASNITWKSKPYLFCLEKQEQILKNVALPRTLSQIWHKSLLWLTKPVECQAFQKTHILHITCEIFLSSSWNPSFYSWNASAWQ